jgi:hypothetical protein
MAVEFKIRVRMGLRRSWEGGLKELNHGFKGRRMLGGIALVWERARKGLRLNPKSRAYRDETALGFLKFALIMENTSAPITSTYVQKNSKECREQAEIDLDGRKLA